MRRTEIDSAKKARPAADIDEQLRIGISGCRYAGWRGKFYPLDLAWRRELEFAGNTFSSVEINGSFDSLQLPFSYQRWYSETAPTFVFSVKGLREAAGR